MQLFQSILILVAVASTAMSATVTVWEGNAEINPALFTAGTGQVFDVGKHETKCALECAVAGLTVCDAFIFDPVAGTCTLGKYDPLGTPDANPDIHVYIITA